MNNTTPKMYDEDTDLSSLDRGDEVVNATEKSDEAEAQQRDDKGRFATSGKSPSEEVDETAKAIEGTAAKKIDAENAAKTEGEEHDEEHDEEPTGKTIPYSRFKQVLQQRNELMDKLAATTLAVKTPEPVEQVKREDPLDALRTKRDELITKVETARADNDVDTAISMQREIGMLDQQIVAETSARAATKAVVSANQNARFDTMLDVIEATFEVLDPNSDAYDKDTVALLKFQVTAHEKMGQSAPDALRNAVKLIFRTDPFAPAKRPAKNDDAAPTKAKSADKPVDIAKAVDLAKRQPPDAAARGANVDQGKINVLRLSEDEFAKLPESTKAELRGDIM